MDTGHCLIVHVNKCVLCELYRAGFNLLASHLEGWDVLF